MALSLPIRVYYEDTDASGVVYHAVYLRYFERARTEWLRALGLSHSKLGEQAGVAFAVSTLTVDFRRPARLDDALVVTADVERVKRASLEFNQNLHRDGDTLLARARVRVACVDATRFRPCGLPRVLREKLLAERRSAMPHALNLEHPKA